MDMVTELYYGNIQPNLRKHITSEGYNKAITFLDDNEERLLEMLSGDEKALYHKILTAQGILTGESDVAHFRMGFKLGAKMMLDTFMDGEPLPVQDE